MSFRVIVADPPWAFQDRLTMSAVRRGAASQYNTLAKADLMALPVTGWAAEDAILALWVPSSLMQDGLDVMQGMGVQAEANLHMGEDQPARARVWYGPLLSRRDRARAHRDAWQGGWSREG